MNKRQLQLTLASLVAAVALLLTGCGSHGTDGDPGKVRDKDRDYVKTGKRTGHYDYDLEIERTHQADIDAADGDRTYWIDVSSDVYDDCVRGSNYPKCAK